MRCSTCGEHLREHEQSCPTCGAAVGRAVVSTAGVTTCPRCGYVGGGIDYFRRAGHVGLLVGVSIFTYGLGGLAYWLMRRRHRICPQCGLNWAQFGGNAGGALRPSGSAVGNRYASGNADPESLPRAGIGRRVVGVAMALFAGLMISIGFVELEMAAVAVGSVAGAGGTAMFWWGVKAQQERRRAVMAGLQKKVLGLATEKGGTLTVTEVAASMNLSLPAAEKILDEMDDGFRVRSDVTDQGIIVYEFPEVRHHPRLQTGQGEL
jgi:ribosomal protein L32